MKIIRKLSLKLILLQLLSLFFFEQAFFQFYYYLHADLFECILRGGGNSLRACVDTYLSPDVTPGYLLTQSFYALFYGLCFGLLLTFILNLVKRKSLWNTATLILLYLALFFTGAFKGRVINLSLNSFAGLFSSRIGISCLIASQVAFILGILLVWLSIKDFTRQKES